MTSEQAVTVAAVVCGFAIGVLVVLAIIEARRRGLAALTLMNPELPDGTREVLRVLESASIVLDPSNNVLEISPQAVQFGLYGTLTGVNHEILEAASRVRRTGDDQELVLEIPMTSMSPLMRSLRVRATRLGSRYVLVLALDQTDALKIEEMRRDFVANISHELKTPIGALALLAEAIAQGADDEELVTRFAGRLEEETRRLGHLTREIIELSRLQSADPLQNPERVSLNEILRGTVEQLAVTAEAKGVRVVFSEDLDVAVPGDRSLLAMCFHNLVSNAVQYSNPNSQVGIGLHVDGEGVEVAVTDTGVGIQTRDLERIFERFYRVDASRTRHTGGTGLGLSIVKHIVQNHGGEVHVWSVPGTGSTFTVSLPVWSAADEQRAKKRASVPEVPTKRTERAVDRGLTPTADAGAGKKASKDKRKRSRADAAAKAKDAAAATGHGRPDHQRATPDDPLHQAKDA